MPAPSPGLEEHGVPRLPQTFAYYFEPRMARIFLLGIISGFPWVLIGSSLNLWLQEDGLSRSTIGWAGLIFGVYAFNFLWAPLIDRIRMPWLTDRIGHRRAWIVALQVVILASLVVWSLIDPLANLAAVIAVGLVIAIASATQDITIDALRIEQVGQAEGEAMAAGAATAVVGWWTGYQDRRDHRPRDGPALPGCRFRQLLADDLPGAGSGGHCLQHRPDVRARSAGRRAAWRVRPTTRNRLRARCRVPLPGSAPPWPGR